MILKNRAACYLKLVSTGNMLYPETLFRVKTLFWLTADCSQTMMIMREGGGGEGGGGKGTGEQGGPSLLLPVPCMATATHFC